MIQPAHMNNNWNLVEIRSVILPDGQRERIVATRLHWAALDEDLPSWGFPLEEVVSLAWADSSRTGRPFSGLFVNLIAVIAQKIAEKRREALAQGKFVP